MIIHYFSVIQDWKEEIEMQECQVYSATEIAKLLGLGKTKTYEFLNEVFEKGEPFRVIKVGVAVRVPKASFDKWLNAG